MVGGDTEPRTQWERGRKRELGRGREEKKTQEKKDARVSGEEFEEGNMRPVLIFAYSVVKSRTSQTTSV